MATPPTGTGPTPKQATTRERDIIDRLYRAADVNTDRDAKLVMFEAVTLLVELIETRNRRQTNGFFNQGEPGD